MKHEQMSFEPRPQYGLTHVCPHNVHTGHHSTYVGSIKCQQCRHNVSSDMKNGAITCSFIGDQCDKARDSAKDGPNV